MRVFLTIALAALLGTCSSTPDLLDQILETGELRVVTRNSPVAYVVGPDGPEGPEFDLVQAFAEELGVMLVLQTVDSVAEVVPYLISGRVHMAAAGLSITESRQEYVNFGYPYEVVDMQLIYRSGQSRPRSIEDLVGRRIAVVAGSSHADMMAALADTIPDIEWIEEHGVEVTDLLQQVAQGELDLTIADSTTFGIQRRFFPKLRVAMSLEEDDPLAWAFTKESGNSLLARADEFLINAGRRGVLAQVHDRYYGHTKKFDYVGTRSFVRHFESRLPRYRSAFEQAGKDWGVDWRLLAAIGYQESHWRPQAVSPTGVRGIMMLTRATADYLGIDDRIDPENSIFGGAQYFSRQTERIADTVDEPDRTWMALAAYNVGFNHLKDARIIVEMQGGNPDRWLDMSRALPLLAKPKWYSRLPYGYARGWEPVLYVNNVRAYYDLLVWLTGNEMGPDEDQSTIAATRGRGRVTINAATEKTP